MDFGTLLHMAKKNSESSKDSGKYYSTKFSPPKKESKEKRLSDNIQKFLQKREQEERERQREQRDKVAKLLAMRDEKSKNKIRKMLKVTKSANKSVLDDAVNEEHTAITMQGGDQPDQDDYGYTSTEANAFYQKYMEKVKYVKEDKGFAPSRPQSIKDLSGTKERVKAALTREMDEKNGPRQRHGKDITTATSTPIKVEVGKQRSSSKNLYNPEDEKIEEERKKREELKKKRTNRKPQPPPMDFQSLLKLAEKKQYEPIEILVPVKTKEPERLLTLKEKKELEERKRAREARERRDRERMEQPISQKVNKEHNSAPTSTSNTARIPKLKQFVNNKPNVTTKSLKSEENKKPFNKSVKPTATSTSTPAPTKAATTPNSKAYGSSSNQQMGKSKDTTKNSVREFPARDVKTQKAREPPARELPPNHVKKANDRISNNSKKSTNLKRRIEDDDSEYDSEMDDFIDDGDVEEDYSSHIKAIFGYDRSKYSKIEDDDDDDAAMESSFAQVQREEFISKKIGIQEDLEDMKLEAMEKKRKMMMKKRRFND